MQGWIKLHRKLTEKGYYKKSEYVHLWVHLLLKANHKPNEFMWNKEIILIKEGQLLTGRKQLAKETGISQTTIERILQMLENEHQIGQQKTTKFRIITIVNWKNYQIENLPEHQNGQQTDNKRTTNGQQTDTNNNDNNEENENNDKKKTYSEDCISLALLLAEKIRQRKADYKVSNIESWHKDMDAILRIDKRPPETVRKVIIWCQNDGFWQNNILSVAKLRKQFDQLELKSNGTNSRNGNASKTGGINPVEPKTYKTANTSD